MVDILPEHRMDCRKCGGNDFKIDYHDGSIIDEHLAVLCKICGYTWQEKCRDYNA